MIIVYNLLKIIKFDSINLLYSLKSKSKNITINQFD